MTKKMMKKFKKTKNYKINNKKIKNNKKHRIPKIIIQYKKKPQIGQIWTLIQNNSNKFQKTLTNYLVIFLMNYLKEMLNSQKSIRFKCLENS
jgi:hypothetical protein